ncbi:guanine nucleotide-binding protein subunit gamma 4-like [Musa acuminata AAA Group]|uniref:guanine nucleotide-binding protein subunit gamma 4-like n=1 Tax=Musa acuminata AAA Group TaxID=214697 RepID=UPI0031D6000C
MAAAEALEEKQADATQAPRPRSPRRYTDLCGRHRLQARVQLLSREIGFLEEELQSVEGLQLVSVCCKEVDKYVGTTPDPLIPTYKKRHKSCCFSRWLRAMVCFNATCFTGGCSSWQNRPCCTRRPNGSCSSSGGYPSRSCCSVSCSRLRCVIPSLSCPGYSCGCVCSCSNCTKVRLCPTCLCCISHCVCE